MKKLSQSLYIKKSLFLHKIMATISDFFQDPQYQKKFILEKLMQEFTGYTREELRTHDQEELSEEQTTKIKKAYQDYVIEKKPLEYVVGHVDFFGNPFFVDENTLIPRPETEYMISAITEWIEEKKKRNAEHQTLLDIGTGCGVLGISVLLQNPQFFDQIFFCDISEGALKIAEKNYHNLIKEEYQTTFLTSNLTDFVKDFEGEEGNSVILVANLPYIPEETFDNNALETVQKREPRIAFVGGDDGLDLYRTMFHQIETHIQNKKLNPENLELFLEMMTWQVDILRKEFKNLTFEEVKTFHFNIRIVKTTF